MSAQEGALHELFARTRAEGRAALIGYLPAGFPSLSGVGRSDAGDGRGRGGRHRGGTAVLRPAARRSDDPGRRSTVPWPGASPPAT